MRFLRPLQPIHDIYGMDFERMFLLNVAICCENCYSVSRTFVVGLVFFCICGIETVIFKYFGI